jgi:hypothetical protein
MLAMQSIPEGVQSGRIATFTFPDMPFNELLALRDRFGFDAAPPLTTYPLALTAAVQDLCAGYRHGRVRWVPRALRGGTSEIVREVLIGEGAEVAGERHTIGHFKIKGGSIVASASDPDLRDRIESGDLRTRVEHHRYMVPAGAVGTWAADCVTELGGAPLPNRGHSFHVLAPLAPRFDRFLAAMVAAAGDKSLVSVFATIDNDPNTLATLARACTARLGAAVDAATEEAAKAVTPRGVRAAVERLRALVSSLNAYKDLLGDTLTAAQAEAEAAACKLIVTEL